MPIDTEKCIYNRNGKCYFLASEASECKLCPNFVSADPSLLREFKINRPVITHYDIISSDPAYKRIFGGGKGIQKTLF